MSQDLEDYIYSLWDGILSSKQGYERDLYENYLRSTCQKLRFAEERLEGLKEGIETFFQAKRDNQILNSFGIEMDFDHCILSLRSSLEHLAQLISSIVPLQLSPRLSPNQAHVTLNNVIIEIEKSELLKNNEHLSNLSSCLKSEIRKDWFTDLNDLRIDIFHHSLGRLPRTSLLTLNRQLLELEFLLPDGTCKNLVTKEERDIVSYCESSIGKVEDLLKKSFDLLSKYISSSKV